MRRLLLGAAFLLIVSTSATAQIIPPGIQTINAADECVTWDMPGGAYSITAQVTGTFSGTITFRGTADGQTYFDIAATNLSTNDAATTTTATGQYAVANAGLVKIRACMTAYTSGGANISLTRGYGMARGGAGSTPSFSTVTVNPGPVTVTSDALGTTSFRGFLGENTTAAAAGAQQYSPMICQEGQGWKTNATAASQSVEFCWEVQPVQGTSAPSGNYLLKASINGGAFSTVGTFTSDGRLVSPLAYILGSADTSGVRLDLESGSLACREGDDSAYCTFLAGAIMSSGKITAATDVQLGASGNLIFASRAILTSENASNIRVNAGTNTYDITLADWGTTQSAEAVSVADTAVLTGPSSGAGFLVISIGTDNNVCTFALTGTSAPVEINDPGTLCSVSASTAASINVYYSSGYKIENLRGGTRALRIQFIGG